MSSGNKESFKVILKAFFIGILLRLMSTIFKQTIAPKEGDLILKPILFRRKLQ